MSGASDFQCSLLAGLHRSPHFPAREKPVQVHQVDPLGARSHLLGFNCPNGQLHTLLHRRQE